MALHSEGSFLTPDQIHFYENNGYLVLEKLISGDHCDSLSQRAASLVDSHQDEFDKAIFSTTDQEKTSNEWLLGSGDQIRLFMEEASDNENSHRVNKVGHALHDLDPEFMAFSRQAPLATIARDIGFRHPHLVQSMYIFKQPRIGGEVSVHQDSTFLHTQPLSCVGFWVAIQEATLENGCLWALPGGHREALRKRFHRVENGTSCTFETLDSRSLPKVGYVPLEVPKGTLVLLHGNLPHYSEANRSEKPREAYALHVVEKEAYYPQDNWLQRRELLPFKGF